MFLTFISSFSLVVYIVRFNTNNKHHFLTYMLTRVFNTTTYNSTAIDNEDRKKINRRNTKTQFFNF